MHVYVTLEAFLQQPSRLYVIIIAIDSTSFFTQGLSSFKFEFEYIQQLPIHSRCTSSASAQTRACYMAYIPLLALKEIVI